MKADLAACRRAALAVLLLGGYLQLVEWVDLFPWNDIRRGNGQERLDLVLAAATLVLAGGLWRGWRIAAGAGALALAAWAWLQVATWWIPYVRGASPGWERVYARWFDETVSWLPRAPGRLPPDANHLVLHALIVVALAACLAAALSKPRRAGPARR